MRRKIEDLERLNGFGGEAENAAQLSAEFASSQTTSTDGSTQYAAGSLRRPRVPGDERANNDTFEPRHQRPEVSQRVSCTSRSRNQNISQHAERIDPLAFTCHCTERTSNSPIHLFMCENCSQSQHQACSSGILAFGEIPPLLCNGCKASHLEQLIVKQQAQADELQAIIDEKREAMDKLYSKALWRVYCGLPHGAAPVAVIEATRTEYRHGQMVPIFPAPHKWIDEVRFRVSKLMNAAGDELSRLATGPGDLDGTYDEKILVPWGQLAVWAVHKGPLKGKKSELGVLAELVGLEKKGTFWNG